jgi:hypothetical protein
MLEPTLQRRILAVADEYWRSHVLHEDFAARVLGKEPGHRMADYVDETTTSLLKVHFDWRFEADAKGREKRRSMGDVWIRSAGIFNPINVKAGEQAKKGQPNLVSMQKLLDYIFRRWIDSYYLLIVKFKLPAPIEHKCYLIDLLDWLDFVAFDAGPGQIMLQEHDFYTAYDSGTRPADAPIAGKVEKLFARFEEGVQSLFQNRERRLERQRQLFRRFSDSGEFVIDQSGMHFVP